MKNLNQYFSFGLMVTVALSISCSKERKESLPYKATAGLSKVSDVPDMIHSISTGNYIKGGNSGSHTENLKIEAKGTEKILGINSLSFVNYQTDSPLIKDVPIRGREKFKYEVRYELTEAFLHIYKVAEEENIPTAERSYAKTFDDGKVGVPLGGYAVSGLSKKVNDKDSETGEKSHNQKLVSVSKIEDADYYSINKNAFIRFQEAEKSDVFPSDIFEGEWFYAATIVSASGKNKNMIGRDLSLDFKASAVSRVKFVKAKEYVRAVNLNVDENLDTNDDINLESTIVLPVEWLDIRRSKKGDQAQMQEELLGNKHVDSKKWDQRKFMKIDFTKAKSSISDGESANVQFEDLRLTQDFISFTLFYEDAGIKVRFALKKAPSKPKKGRIYLKEDRRIYGIFPTEKKHYDGTYRVHREEDKEKFKLINRFMPENKKIVYRFTHGSEEIHRYAGRESVRVWNEAFKKAKTGIEVVIDESFDVDLGDIRYNAINIVDEVDEGGLLGYGPSIVDTASGEIISATANIYVNPFREGAVKSLRNYVKSKLGLLNPQYIGTLDLNVPSSDTLGHRKFLTELVNSKNLSEKEKKNFSNQIEKLKTNSTEKNFNRVSSCASYGKSNAEIIRRVENICPEIKDYIAELKSSDKNESFNENELKYLEPCAAKLIPLETLETMVHEMGHNLGLRHNFIGSIDKDNFYKLTLKSELIPKTFVEELKKLTDQDLKLNPKKIAEEAIKAGDIYEATASTVMEYMPPSKRRLLRPGAYDVEAIRFSYANSVKAVVDGKEKIIKLNDPTLTIDETIAKKTQGEASRKLIKFCTDEHVDLATPLCRKHDAGVTPVEIVDNIIMEYNQTFALINHKNDKADSFPGEGIANYVTNKLLIPLKTIHDQWRFHLMEFVGKDNKYLENFNQEVYEKQVLPAMAKSPKFKELYELWKPAADKAYAFLKKLTFLSDKYCVIENNEGAQELASFSTIQDEVYTLTKQTVHSCKDKAVAERLGNEFKVVKEVGYSYNDIKKDLDMNAVDVVWSNGKGRVIDTSEVIGTKLVRNMALAILGTRATFLRNMMLNEFAPNFIDDPNFRDDLQNAMLTRVMEGQKVSDLGLDEKKFGPYLPKFKIEKDLIAGLFSIFKNALNVPSNVEETAKRAEVYSVVLSQILSQVQGAPGLTKFGPYYLAAPSRNSLAFFLINKREEIKDVESKSSIKEIPGISAEILTTQIGFAPKAKDAALLLKVKDYMATFEAINAMAKDPKLPMNLKEAVKIYFAGDFELAEIINSQSKEFIAALMEMTMGDVISKYFEEDVVNGLYLEENVENLDKKFTEGASLLIEKIDDFVANRAEYKAQIETLARTLLNLAN